MSSTPHVQPIYLTLQQAAAEGYAAYSTLRKYITDGRLPAVKVGPRVKVLRADLEALAVAVRPATFEEIEAAAERLAASAPPLNDAQVRRLSTIFGGAA
ncbi:helix-turn-helix domain-containing protein [Corynebacterium sp.]|uniref:helix-turn-helix domain-containing protein n=1 Tax=Corynebacterium sp. TaxID=1720 RepID=UPI0026478895|nr:helix-turn-helix domain-containing protein [Corynebacterium sp.]MDN6137043.1 helix-turn-helix domain-containing protein [Corynebacterium sp.]MDN6737194.1 helix-turn-helix domain-containing protein [Corynebacterium sp.]